MQLYRIALPIAAGFVIHSSLLSAAEIARWEREAAAQRARNEPTLPSTIAREKSANPFLRCDQPAVIASASKYAGKPLTDPVSVLGVIRDWKNNF